MGVGVGVGDGPRQLLYALRQAKDHFQEKSAADDDWPDGVIDHGRRDGAAGGQIHLRQKYAALASGAGIRLADARRQRRMDIGYYIRVRGRLEEVREGASYRAAGLQLATITGWGSMPHSW